MKLLPYLCHLLECSRHFASPYMRTIQTLEEKSSWCLLPVVEQLSSLIISSSEQYHQNDIIRLNRRRKMGSLVLHEFKRQASFYFKEKIKTARLALTDVTPAELLTEEATNSDLWVPDTRTLRAISRAAFEVDDYWRIVDILHKRLMKFDTKNWRVSYRTLLLLEHLLTHGPLRAADEFQDDKAVIKEIGSFQFIDEKGFDWGLSVRNLAEKVLKLLESGLFLKEERARTRKISREIQGFGSFSHRSTSDDGTIESLTYKTYWRCNSEQGDKHNQKDQLWELKKRLLEEETKDQQSIQPDPTKFIGDVTMEDHPFVVNDHHTRMSLL